MSKTDIYRFVPEAINDCSPADRVKILTGIVERLSHFVDLLELMYTDNHYWSTRPCSTCDRASAALQLDVGCTRYRKDPKNQRGG